MKRDRDPVEEEAEKALGLRPRRLKWGEPGSKCTRRTRATVFSRGARPVIVTIYPDGVIGFRLSKQRREEFRFADDCYREAVIARKAQEREAKRKARKGAKR